MTDIILTEQYSTGSLLRILLGNDVERNLVTCALTVCARTDYRQMTNHATSFGLPYVIIFWAVDLGPLYDQDYMVDARRPIMQSPLNVLFPGNAGRVWSRISHEVRRCQCLTFFIHPVNIEGAVIRRSIVVSLWCADSSGTKSDPPRTPMESKKARWSGRRRVYSRGWHLRGESSLRAGGCRMPKIWHCLLRHFPLRHKTTTTLSLEPHHIPLPPIKLEARSAGCVLR